MGYSRSVHATARGSFALILAVAGALTTATTISAAEGLRTSVTVRVYQTADLPFALEQRVLAEAERVLRGALVDVRWRTCGTRDTSSACTDAAESDLILRMALEETPRPQRPPPLGEAIVSGRTGGVLASVYVDRVAALADETQTDIATLLGRVVAHELAHLMMRTDVRHARIGLMRPNWTPEEIRRNRAIDWAFTAEDVAAIRR